MKDAANWLGAWFIVIVLVVAASQSGWGRTLAYYFLWLAVVLLVVTHASEFTSILQAGGFLDNGQSTGN
jgi:succinate-acetate transporter protein